MMKLYFIRHGQTDWNVAGKIQGRMDIPLNDTGRIQARFLAEAMERRPVQAVFSSPQKRARETAEAVGSCQGVQVILLPQLMEISYGVWEGRTTDDILETDRELFEAWWEHPSSVAPPGGETLDQVRERCLEAWEQIKSTLKGDSAIVSHGSTLAHLLSLILEEERDDDDIVVGNASITTVEYEPGTGSCSLLEANDSSHLLL